MKDQYFYLAVVVLLSISFLVLLRKLKDQIKVKQLIALSVLCVFIGLTGEVVIGANFFEALLLNELHGFGRTYIIGLSILASLLISKILYRD